MTKRLDASRDGAGVRLRAARLRRGMTQTALAELACLSPAFVSMVETGQRELTRVYDIIALADILRISPLYLADGREDTSTPGLGPTQTGRSPARCDPITLARHQQLARHFIDLARQDARAAGDWLRRLAREPAVTPWLLIDQLATLLPRPVTQGNEPPTARPGQPAAVLAQDAAAPGSPAGVEHLARFGADFADLADPDVMSAAWGHRRGG
jgi:transcriptional regulator with XRE-family HTH domain